MYKLFEVILVTGLSCFFLTEMFKLFIWDQFFVDKPYYFKVWNVIDKIASILIIFGIVVGLGGLLVLALIG